RPTLRYQVDRYDERQRHRLDVKPGLTGWAQVNGRAALPWEERIELDLWYIEHRSTALDLKILALTPFALFRGTYKGATGGSTPSTSTFRTSTSPVGTSSSSVAAWTSMPLRAICAPER